MLSRHPDGPCETIDLLAQCGEVLVSDRRRNGVTFAREGGLGESARTLAQRIRE